MRKYQGRLIHQGHDALGPIEVVDDGTFRSLHFGSDARQSSMLLRDPYALALSYTRAMCAALLLCEAPSRVLLLGLGGGSLAKFLLHHYAHCHIDAVECRPEVYRIARDFFALPDDARLRLHYQDAGHFVRLAEAALGEYDLILVDAFLDDGVAFSVCGSGFFAACRDRLSHSGVLAINLWADDRIHADELLTDMALSFNGQILRLPVEGRANLIGIATCQAAPRRRLRSLGEGAKRLEGRTGVEFPALLKELRKANHGLF